MNTTRSLIVEKILKIIVSPNRIISIFAFAVSLIAGIHISLLMTSDPFRKVLSSNPDYRLYMIFGFLLFFVIIGRSIATDILTIWKNENKIVCGSGIVGTSYDYDSLMRRKPDEIIIVGQNLATLISRKDFLPDILSMLKSNPKFQVTLILTTDNILKEVFPLAYKHLFESVELIRTFMDEQLTTDALKNRFFVHFHPAAATLSAFICDPTDNKKGIIVFTPKWADDATPADRIYCSVECWENNGLFNRLYGPIPRMTKNDSISIDQMVTRLASQNT